MALKNLITDVAGVRVGHAEDARLASGVTAIIFEDPAVASIDVRGGGPGTREADLLDPAMTVERMVSLFESSQKELQQTQLGMNLIAVCCQRLAKRREGKGRVPVVEIMMNTPIVRKYILDGEFEKLKGTVGNKEAGSQSFDLGSSYLTPDGHTVTSITLPPTTGLILTSRALARASAAASGRARSATTGRR